ncbi:M23 family metallopeptidase [Cellulophaga baltica]|uniref:M23 family metallopeptidase n=1 Tax=Cellulophaga TaxID=104264 RepID=UPI001C0719D7|nr:MULTISPECIES: M23 family metallopeptidase [Cellulophaga]MBU2997945.1 M23 family metallopeptidase [Cellulophaga baltica]MDO6769346.1 M23 family metallopeptidase [Cellulophaga sp. 1_MG-2023]
MKLTKLIKHVFLSSFIFIATSCADELIGNVGELDEDIFLNYQTITVLELPFEDDAEWHINQGGRTGLQNNHFSNRNQRYAIDCVQKLNGISFIGDGTSNEDYYCFGKRLNSPGYGKIIALENDIIDNTIPGSVNSDIDENTKAGNYIIIDHLNGEYSLMAHFKKGTIMVSVGDIVVKGQEVGKAGNSGNSGGPHLHYHLQNKSGYLEGIGLPMQFLNYYADDVFIERGEPVKSEVVRKE